MTLNTDFRSAVQLTGAARAAIDAVSSALPLNRWLPNQSNPTLTYSFATNEKQDVDLAEFRSFDAEAPYGRSFGKITKEGKLPPISRKLPVSEFTELQYAAGAEALGGVLDGYAGSLGRGFAFRFELARAEAVRTGKLVLSENGLNATIDYGRDSSLTVTPSTKWSVSATATPLSDVIGWRQLKKLAQAPTAMLITLDAIAAASTTTEVIEAVVGRSDNLPARVSYDDVRNLFGRYGISSVTVVDDAYSQFNISPFPSGSVVLLPGAGAGVLGGSLGVTAMGIPAEALQPSYGIPRAEAAGLFAGAFSREDPIGLDVLVSGIGLPVVQNANATVGASVL